MTKEAPKWLGIKFSSDTIISGLGGGASGVDIELDATDEGLQVINGKTIHGLLRDSWLSMSDCFQTLSNDAIKVFGAGGSLDDTAILHVDDAGPDPLTRKIVSEAVADEKSQYNRQIVLDSLSYVIWRTSRTKTGEPEKGSLRSCRVWLRDTVLWARLDWREPPTPEVLEVLGKSARGVKNIGLSRNRGSGIVECFLANEALAVCDNSRVDELVSQTDKLAGLESAI